MPTPLDVEKQRFNFGDAWTIAFKYDDSNFYRNRASKLQGDVDGIPVSAKAVDVVAMHHANGLLLLEAKDFRGHRIPNKCRINNKEVAVEVAAKVRDTVAALIGAARTDIVDFESQDLAIALGRGKTVSVALWIEDDSFRNISHAKAMLATLNSKLKEQLAWLGVKSIVLSSSTANRLPDLEVTNLAGTGS